MELRQKNVEYPCILCKRPVRPRQQAVECDNCYQWQHRTCNTGINNNNTNNNNNNNNNNNSDLKYSNNSDLKLIIVEFSKTLSGIQFQSFTVLLKYEYLLTYVLVYLYAN